MDNLKQLAKEEIQRAMRMGRRLFNTAMPTPKIVWKSRRHTRVAGWYVPRTNEIHLYEYYLERFGINYVMDTPSHEAAHAVMHFAHRDRPVENHGPEFRGFMRHIGRSDSIYHHWGDDVRADKAVAQRARPLSVTNMIDQTAWPVKIKTSSKFISELSGCEYGSYEDMLNGYGDVDPDDPDRGLHIVEILERHKTIIELRNRAERSELLYALETGTIDSWMPMARDKMVDLIRTIQWPE